MRNTARHVRIPQQRRSIEKRSSILEVAYTIFGSKGYHNVTTIDIAHASGLSTGTVYSYFTDKKAIFLETLENYFNAIDARLLDSFQGTIPGQNVNGVIRKFIATLIEANEAMHSFHKELMSLIYTDPDVHQSYIAHHNKVINMITGQLSSWNISTSTEALYLVITMMENISREINYNPKTDLDKENLIQLCEGFVRYLISISPPNPDQS